MDGGACGGAEDVGGGCEALVGGRDTGVEGSLGLAGSLGLGAGGCIAAGGVGAHAAKVVCGTNTVAPVGVTHVVPLGTNCVLELPDGRPAGQFTFCPR